MIVESILTVLPTEGSRSSHMLGWSQQLQIAQFKAYRLRKSVAKFLQNIEKQICLVLSKTESCQKNY